MRYVKKSISVGLSRHLLQTRIGPPEAHARPASASAKPTSIGPVGSLSPDVKRTERAIRPVEIGAHLFFDRVQTLRSVCVTLMDGPSQGRGVLLPGQTRSSKRRPRIGPASILIVTGNACRPADRRRARAAAPRASPYLIERLHDVLADAFGQRIVVEFPLSRDAPEIVRRRRGFGRHEVHDAALLRRRNVGPGRHRAVLDQDVARRLVKRRVPAIDVGRDAGRLHVKRGGGLLAMNRCTLTRPSTICAVTGESATAPLPIVSA